MKRTMSMLVAAIGSVALFAGLVHAVMVAAHVSTPAAVTVQGMTPRRLWATSAALLGLVGVVAGGWLAARSTTHLETTARRRGAHIAVGAGIIACVNGGLNLAIANGGPGTGNGVIGGAAAFVLGLIALTLGGRAVARSRGSASEPGQTR